MFADWFYHSFNFTGVLVSLIEFHLVFSEFYWVSQGGTALDWVSPDLTQFCLM